MELERQNKVVEVEVRSRLNIGGRWYYPGQKVSMDAADAEVYAMRGLTSRPIVPKAAPPTPEQPKEVLRPEQVGVQTKEDSQPAAEEQSVSSKDTGITKPEEANNGRQSSRRNR